MKLTILVASLIVCFTASISANENALLKALNDPEIKNALFKSAQETLQSKVPETLDELRPLVEKAFGFFVLGQLNPENRAVIIPPGLLPEVIPLPPLDLPNINLLDGLLTGSLSINNAKLEGLHTLTDEIAANVTTEPLGINANYTIILPWLSLNSDYKADLALDIGAITPIVGEGRSDISMNDTFLNIGLYVTQKGVDRANVSVQLTFEIPILNLFLENLLIGNAPIEDWEPLSETLRINLEALVQTVLSPIGNILSVLLGELTKECTFKEIMDLAAGAEGADLSCVVIPWPPVLPTEPPPVEVTSETPKKNGASGIHFNIMYLEILTIIGVFYSALIH